MSQAFEPQFSMDSLKPTEVTVSRTRNKLLAAVALILLSVVLIAPFFYSNSVVVGGRRMHVMIGTHDMTNHMVAMQQFDRSLRAGILEPRWSSDINNGYGSATLNFYPRLFYYATSLVNLLARDWETTLFILAVLTLGGSAVSFYWLARMFYSPGVSAIAALSYMLLPYHQLDLYWRGAVPEFAGFVLLPLILGFAIKLGAEPSRGHYAALGLVYGVHLMLHMPVGLLFSYAMVLFALIWSVMRRDIRVALRIGGGMALGVLFSSTYWLPAVVEARYVYEPMSAIQPYHSTYIDPRVIGFGFEGLIVLVFKFNLILLLGFLISRSRFAAVRPDGAEVESPMPSAPTWAALCGAALFMCTYYSYDISRLLPGIQAAVPAFRWLAVASLFSGLLIAAAVESIRKREMGLIGKVAIATVLALNLWLVIGGVIVAATKSGGSASPSAIVNSGFIPAGATHPEFLADTPNIQIQPEGGLSESLKWSPEYRQVRVRVEQPSTVRLKTYNFAGWTAIVDGQRSELRSDDDGIQTVHVEAGMHIIETSFKNTWPRTAGQVLSMIGAALILALGFQGRKRAAEQDAEARAWSWSKLKDRKLVVATAAVIAVSIVVIVIVASKSNSNQSSKDPTALPSSSETPVDADATLFIQNVSTISIAVDEKALDQLVDALAHRDTSRVEELTQAGKLVTVENRTRVRLLERRSGKVKVRIAEGKFQWVEGWVPEPWLH